MKLTRRKLATLLTATAAVVQAAPQAPTPATEPDDATAARAAMKANLNTLANTKLPITIEPATQFKA